MEGEDQESEYDTGTWSQAVPPRSPSPLCPGSWEQSKPDSGRQLLTPKQIQKERWDTFYLTDIRKRKPGG